MRLSFRKDYSPPPLVAISTLSAVRGLAWTQAERVLPPDIQLHRPRQEDEADPHQARGQEHTDGVPGLRRGYQGISALQPTWSQGTCLTQRRVRREGGLGLE